GVSSDVGKGKAGRIGSTHRKTVSRTAGSGAGCDYRDRPRWTDCPAEPRHRKNVRLRPRGPSWEAGGNSGAGGRSGRPRAIPRELLESSGDAADGQRPYSRRLPERWFSLSG